MILIRRTWTRQPQNVPRINRADALGRTITHCLPLNGFPYEIVTGAQLTLGVGGSWGVGSLASGVRAIQGSGGNACASVPIDLSSYTKAAVSFWMYWNAYVNDDDLALEYGANFVTNSGFFIDPNSGAPASGAFQAGVGSVGAANSGQFTRPSAAAWHHYAFNFDRTTGTAQSTAVWVDGVSQSVSAVGTLGNVADNFGNNNLYIFSRAGTSLFGAGKMTNLVIRGGYLMSELEVQAEYQNAWRIYEPRAMPIPMSAAASGLPTLTALTASNITASGWRATLTAA